MTNYKDGRSAEVGDMVKFIHEGEVHFGKVAKLYEGGKADLIHVRHIPTAIEHSIDLTQAELAHR